MKPINKIYYKEIKKLFLSNNIHILSKISDNEDFSSINSISNAKKNDLTFLSNSSLIDLLRSTQAKACIISKSNLKFLNKDTIPIIVDDPFKAFSLVTNLFKKKYLSSGIISNYSSIDKNTKLYKNVQIDSFVTIKDNTIIHPNVIIESHCTIGPNVIIYDDSIIKSNSVIKFTSIGSNCIIKEGAIIGGTGFGFHPISKDRIQHFGDVIIKNNCNIGSNTTIDRAVFESTIISNNCFIDNLVQIAHNVTIGDGGIIAAQVGIAGSTNIGKNISVGGQAGISGHLKIGNNVKIAAKSGVTKNISDNSIVAGFPAVDIKKWKLTNIKLNKLL